MNDNPLESQLIYQYPYDKSITIEDLVLTSVQYKLRDEPVVWLQTVKYYPVSNTNRWTTGLTTEGQVLTSVQYKQMNHWSDYRRSSSY